jgi:hypothetical protein
MASALKQKESHGGDDDDANPHGIAFYPPHMKKPPDSEPNFL